jgi:hypothetical protein
MTGITPSAADARWRSIIIRVYPLNRRAYVHVNVQGHKGTSVEWRSELLNRPVEDITLTEDPSEVEVLRAVHDTLGEILQRMAH